MDTIRIFVSSRFREFDTERDSLRDVVGPQLDEETARYGCRVDLIDLRWGTAHDTGSDEQRHLEVLEGCIDEIRRCDVFVGLVGRTDGWVPPTGVARRALVGHELPKLWAGQPLTAIEFRAACLLGARPDGFPSVIFRRTGPAHQELSQLERAVDELDFHVRDYAAGSVHDEFSAFEQLAARALKQVVTSLCAQRARRFSGIEDRNRYVAERRHVERFVDARGICSQLIDLTRTQPVCIAGGAGTGKSAEAQEVALRLRDAGESVILHRVVTQPVEDQRRSLIRTFGLPADPRDFVALRAALRDVAKNQTVIVDNADLLDADLRTEVLVALCSTKTPLRHSVLTMTDPRWTALRPEVRVVRLGKLTAAQVSDVLDRSRLLVSNRPPRRVRDIVASERLPVEVDLIVGQLKSLGATDFEGLAVGEHALVDRMTTFVTDLELGIDPILDRVERRMSARFDGELSQQFLRVLALTRDGLERRQARRFFDLDARRLAVLLSLSTGVVEQRPVDDHIVIGSRHVSAAITARAKPVWIAQTHLALADFFSHDTDQAIEALWHRLSAGDARSIAAGLSWAADAAIHDRRQEGLIDACLSRWARAVFDADAYHASPFDFSLLEIDATNYATKWVESSARSLGVERRFHLVSALLDCFPPSPVRGSPDWLIWHRTRKRLASIQERLGRESGL